MKIRNMVLGIYKSTGAEMYKKTSCDMMKLIDDESPKLSSELSILRDSLQGNRREQSNF